LQEIAPLATVVFERCSQIGEVRMHLVLGHTRHGRRVVALALVALTIALVGPSAASAASGALAPLRAWGEKTGKLTSKSSNAAIEERLTALRALVPAAASKLRSATQAARDGELRSTRRALDISLGPLPKRLGATHAFFLFESYQSELEHLTRLARLERAPTGRLMLVSAGQPTIAQTTEEDGQDADDDGVLDTNDGDDDNDGVADAQDATSKGWGIPDAFKARPCVRVTEEIPSFRTIAAAGDWLRLVHAKRRCTTPVPRKDVQAPRQLGKLKLSVSGAKVDSRTLTVKVTAKKAATLTFTVRDGARTLATTKNVKAKKGKRSLKATLNKVASSGMHSLRIAAKVGKKKATGTEPVGVGAAPQPRKNLVSTGGMYPMGSTPVVHGGTIVDERVPSGGSPDKGTSPLAECPNQNSDADSDGVADCVERKGFTYNVYLPGQTAPKATHVVSDPHKANTDGDAETHNDRTYALNDGQEWANSAAGGVTDPAAKDGDGDGLTDVAELERWGTNPAATDTDSDSRGPNRDQPPSAALYDGAEANALHPTSPTLPDTDGDGRSDYDEIVGLHSNPLVAQVPAFDVARTPGTGVQIAINTTKGTLTTSLTSSKTGSSTTDTRTDSTTEDVTTENKGLISGLKGLKDLKGPKTPPKAPTTRSARRVSPRFFDTVVNFATTAFDFAKPYLFDNTTSNSTTLETSTASQRSAEDTYQQSIATDVKVEANGTITASFEVQNPSDRSIQVRDLEIAVFTPCLPLAGAHPTTACTPGELAPLGTLKQIINGSQTTTPSITLGPHSVSAPINVQATVNSTLLQGVLGNPGALVFRPSGGLYNPSTDRTYAGEIGETINRRTAGFTIDYDDGRVHQYAVASSVDRAWGAPNEPVGTRIETILSSLGLANGCPQSGARDCFQFSTAENGRRALLALGDPANPTAPAIFAKEIGADGSIPGAWLVFGKTRSVLGTAGEPASLDLGAVRLAATDKVTIAYAADRDGDGLLDREERLLGTSDTSKDSDGDGATEGSYASDFFESRIGWDVTFPAGTQPRRVYSSPISCDLDRDGLPDGTGAGCTQNNKLGSELRQKTDPNRPDTNGDGILDGAQDDPLTPVGIPTVTKTVTGNDLVATGGQAEGTTWKLPPGGSVAPSSIELCGTGETKAGCKGATGYYRIRWNVTRAAGNDLTPSSYFDQDPIWMRLNVNGAHTFEKNVGGRTVTETQTDDWVTARVQASEEHSPGAYEVYLHATRTIKLAHISLRLQGARGATVQSVTIGTISSDEFKNAPYRADRQTPNPDFAAMAVPGRDLELAAGQCQPGTRTPATTTNPQGVQLENYVPTRLAGGYHLPPSGYRFGFDLRGVAGVTDSRLLLGATSGDAAVSYGEYCVDENANKGIGGVLSLPTYKSRNVLTAASVRSGEIGDGPQRTINLLNSQNRDQAHVSLPVMPEAYPDGTGPLLLHVDIDRTPQVQRSLSTMAWWGLGFSAAQPAEPQPLVTLAGNGATYDGAAAVLPSATNLNTPLLPVGGARELRWFVKHDQPMRISQKLYGGTVYQDATSQSHSGWSATTPCGSVATACAATESGFFATPTTSTTTRVPQLLLMRRNSTG
jgi:hypothetical protein